MNKYTNTNNQLSSDNFLNYLCVDFFESLGITPEQSWLDACEDQIQKVLQQQVEKILQKQVMLDK